MPILSNVRWENFVRGIVAGEFAVKAYVDAGFSRHGARQAAHKLRNHPRVERRIEELRCEQRQEELKVVHAAEQEEKAVRPQLKVIIAKAMEPKPLLRRGQPVMQARPVASNTHRTPSSR